MKYERLFLFSVLSGFFTACADQATSASAAEDPPEVFAIGRYVLSTNRFWDLHDHVESIEPGGIKYDSEFRHPHLPISGMAVVGQKTSRSSITGGIVRLRILVSRITSYPVPMERAMFLATA